MKQKIAEFFLLLQGFRKFIVCLLILIVSIVFRVKNLLSGGEFVDLDKAIVLAFMGSNSMEGLFSVVKEHLQTKRDIAINAPEAPKEEAKDDSNQNVNITMNAGDSK
jgi:predicted Co/Zn/Cd cation transporter (cation efflux family)